VTLPLAVIGVPTSAGAHHAGQDLASAALRARGFVDKLVDAGFAVTDAGDVVGEVFVPDDVAATARNMDAVVAVALAVADAVEHEFRAGRMPIVLGGDCTTWSCSDRRRRLLATARASSGSTSTSSTSPTARRPRSGAWLKTTPPWTHSSTRCLTDGAGSTFTGGSSPSGRAGTTLALTRSEEHPRMGRLRVSTVGGIDFDVCRELTPTRTASCKAAAWARGWPGVQQRALTLSNSMLTPPLAFTVKWWCSWSLALDPSDPFATTLSWSVSVSTNRSPCFTDRIVSESLLWHRAVDQKVEAQGRDDVAVRVSPGSEVRHRMAATVTS